MSAGEKVVVIGGGISGLSTAFWLHRAGADVVLLEADERVGGTIRTIREDGWLIEAGPNTALETTPLLGEMFDTLGISSGRIYARPVSENRYILRDGRLHALPLSPGAFIGSRLWSWRAKLRLLGEPFAGRATREESIAEFVERRLGKEFLDYAINPFVAGVYAGNPEELSVRAAFPKLYGLEEKYGGLVKGMIFGARERKGRAEKAKDRARMFTFAEGMEDFPRAIAEMLGTRIAVGRRVTSITVPGPRNGGEAAGFEVASEGPGGAAVEKARCVVLAVPAHAAAGLVKPMGPALPRTLEGISYPPVAEVFLGFAARQFQRPLDGFGFLVPAVERRRILGTIWSSSLFPGRSPEGYVALTTFIGGARQPALVGEDDAALIGIAAGEIRDILGAAGAPVFSRVMRWQKAIPQYNVGYSRIEDEVLEFERAHPGFFFCSNFRGGIAVGDCVMNAKKTAEKILALGHAPAGESGALLAGGPQSVHDERRE